MTEPLTADAERTDRSSPVVAAFLILFGAVGWIAAFALTLDKFALLENPDAQLGCDYGLLVQCSTNLNSSQGAIFGFPNPLLGVAGWVAPILVGAAMLAGARFARWFRIAFAVGVLGALVLVIWLISQSIFVLGTLCPWCMVTWSVTIPLFWMVWSGILADGTVPVPAAVRRAARVLSGWVPLVTLVSYLVVAVLAQIRLDVIAVLF